MDSPDRGYEDDYEEESPIGVEGLHKAETAHSESTKGPREVADSRSPSPRSRSASSSSRSRSRSSSRPQSRPSTRSHSLAQSASQARDTPSPLRDAQEVQPTAEGVGIAPPESNTALPIAAAAPADAGEATKAPSEATDDPQLQSADREELIALAKARLFSAIPPTPRLNAKIKETETLKPSPTEMNQTNERPPFVYPYPPWLKQAYEEATAKDEMVRKAKTEKANSARGLTDNDNRLLIEDAKERPSSADGGDRLPQIQQRGHKESNPAGSAPPSARLPALLPVVGAGIGGSHTPRTPRGHSNAPSATKKKIPKSPQAQTQKQRLSIDIQIPDHRNDNCSYLPPTVRDAYARMRIEGCKDPSKISLLRKNEDFTAISLANGNRSRSPVAVQAFEVLKNDLDTVFAPLSVGKTTVSSSTITPWPSSSLSAKVAKSVPLPTPPPKLVKQGVGGGGARSIFIPKAPTQHPPGVAQYLRLVSNGPSMPKVINTSTDSGEKAKRYAHRWLALKGEGDAIRSQPDDVRSRATLSSGGGNGTDLASIGFDEASSSAVYGVGGRASSIATTTAGFGASITSISKAKMAKPKRKSPAKGRGASPKSEAGKSGTNANSTTQGPAGLSSYVAAAEGKKNLHQPGDILPLEFDFVAPKHPIFEDGYEPQKRARPPPAVAEKKAHPSSGAAPPPAQPQRHRQASLSDAFGPSARATPVCNSNDIVGDPTDADDAVIRVYTPPPPQEMNEQPQPVTTTTEPSPAHDQRTSAEGPAAHDTPLANANETGAEEIAEEPETQVVNSPQAEDVVPIARALAASAWRYPLAVTELIGNDVALETVDRAILTSADKLKADGRKRSEPSNSQQSAETSQSSTHSDARNDDKIVDQSIARDSSKTPSNESADAVEGQQEVSTDGEAEEEQQCDSLPEDVVAIARTLAASAWRYPLAVTELIGNDVALETVDRAILTSAERLKTEGGRRESENNTSREVHVITIGQSSSIVHRADATAAVREEKVLEDRNAMTTVSTGVPTHDMSSDSVSEAITLAQDAFKLPLKLLLM